MRVCDVLCIQSAIRLPVMGFIFSTCKSFGEGFMFTSVVKMRIGSPLVKMCIDSGKDYSGLQFIRLKLAVNCWQSTGRTRL